MGLLMAACALVLCSAVQAQPKSAPLLKFQITDFKFEAQKYAVTGRGLVRLTRPDFKDKIVSVRLKYVVRLKKDPSVFESSTGATLVDGVGLVEVYFTMPELLTAAVRDGNDYLIVEWSVAGWSLLNPGTIEK
jgi:hypothetical protein